MNFAIRLIFIYKIVCLISGCIAIFCGYKLFNAAILAKTALESYPTGQVIAKIYGVQLTFKEAAPGTLFCVVGAAIIIATILKGFGIEKPNKFRTIGSIPQEAMRNVKWAGQQKDN